MNKTQVYTIVSELYESAMRLAQDRSSYLSQFVRNLAEDYIITFEGGHDHTFKGESLVLDLLQKVLGEDYEGVFIDVGALYGDWSIMVRNRFPKARIVAVEMSSEPRVLDKLKSNADRFNFEVFNVALLPGEVRTVNYYSYPRPEINTLVTFPYANKPNVCQTTAWSGDYLLKEAGIDKVTYLKVDAEGTDFDVIRSFGDRLEDIDIIQFEYGPMCIASRCFLADFYALLMDFNIGRIYYPEGPLFKSYEYRDETFIRGNFLAVKKSKLKIMKALSSRS